VQQAGSIYARLMLASLLPLLIGMAAALLIAVAVFSRTLEDRVAEQVTHAADVLTRSQLPLTAELLRRVAELQRSTFLTLDAQGTVVQSSGPALPAAIRAALDAHRATPRRPDVVHLDLDGEPAIAVFAPISVPGDARVATLVAVASLVDARSVARRAALGLAAATVAAAVLLGLLLHLRINSITRPLEQLSRFAATVAAGARDERVAVRGAGELAALATALNDMTARIGAYERRLTEQSRLSALGEMAARIAHEVRNPLTGLKMQLQLLAERSPPAERPLLAGLLDEVKRLELIVDASLTLRRDRPAELAPTDLGQLVTDVVALHAPALAHRGVEVTTELAVLPPVPADRALLAQALHNLIVNAADALPTGGRVRVRTTCVPSRQRVILSVADSGPGLAAEVAARLEEGPTSSKPYGLGLGLSVCREVALAHGGELVLTARSDLGGAAVALELPLPTATTHGAA
jgi:two-component system nitrogen regulation sensor histidine kinase NtrY